jgi:hypothetical protein
MDTPTLVSLLVGSAITWTVTWVYYRRAGTELRNEAAELRRLTTVVLDALEAGGLAELTREGSRIVAIKIRGRGEISVPQPVIRGIGHVSPPSSSSS